MLLPAFFLPDCKANFVLIPTLACHRSPCSQGQVFRVFWLPGAWNFALSRNLLYSERRLAKPSPCPSTDTCSRVAYPCLSFASAPCLYHPPQQICDVPPPPLPYSCCHSPLGLQLAPHSSEQLQVCLDSSTPPSWTASFPLFPSLFLPLPPYLANPPIQS